MKINLKTEPQEVYWLVTNEYQLEIDGKPFGIRVREDENGAEYYIYDQEEQKWKSDYDDGMYDMIELFMQNRSELEVGKEFDTEE